MSQNTKINISLTKFLITSLLVIVFITFLNWRAGETTTNQTETNPPALAGGIMDEKTTIPTEEITALKADLEKSKKDLEDLKLKTDELEKKN